MKEGEKNTTKKRIALLLLPFLLLVLLFSASAFAETVEMSSTAAAARYAAEQGNQSIAAVAAPGAAPLYGLEVLAKNVQITDANKTRFYVLSDRPLETEGLTRAVFVATCEGSRLGQYHYVIETEDAEGITDAQVGTISALEGVRFAGRFNAAEKNPAQTDEAMSHSILDAAA